MCVKMNIDFEMPSLTENICLSLKRLGKESCKISKDHTVWSGQRYSFHYVFEGNGYLRQGDDEIPIKSGMCFMLYKGRHSEYYPSSKQPWQYGWIDFDGEGLEPLLTLCGFTPDKPYLSYKLEKDLVNEINRLFEFAETNTYRSLCVVAQFLKILGELVYRRNAVHSKSVSFYRVRDSIVYICSNFRESITLTDISKAAGVSVSCMMGYWKKEVDMSPIEFLNAFRVSVACQALRNTDEKVKDIARDVGYEDEKYFARVFKKFKTVSPTEYREEIAEIDPFHWMEEKGIDFR